LVTVTISGIELATLTATGAPLGPETATVPVGVTATGAPTLTGIGVVAVTFTLPTADTGTGLAVEFTTVTEEEVLVPDGRESDSAQLAWMIASATTMIEVFDFIGKSLT
jgi:hypothetical protein